MTSSDSIVIKNVYYMLAYAFRSLNFAQFKSVEAEQFDRIHDLFAAIMAKGIARQLKQGLYREYVVHNDDLVTLRGKIDLPGTTKLRLAQRRQLACSYDELSVDNQLNQIVKSTALLLLRHGDVNPERRSALKKALLFFADVDQVDLSQVRWANIRFGRNNHSYRLLISVCQLVVEGMLISTTPGEHKLLSFIDDQEMSRLYEKFILEYYRKHHPDLHPSASQIDWALDEGARTLLPTMQSDITLTADGRKLIIDAKYYSKNLQTNFDRQTVHSNNLYQVFTYVKNAAYADPATEVSGMLLYAATTAEVQPEARWCIGGNAFTVTTLDLRQDFAGMARKLDEVANGLVEWAETAVEQLLAPEVP